MALCPGCHTERLILKSAISRIHIKLAQSCERLFRILTIRVICLLEIFDRVPLSNLLTIISLVCRRWHQLVQPSALARRDELRLQIVETNNYRDPSCLSSLRWKIVRHTPKSLLKSRLDWIGRSLRSVSSLFIFFATEPRNRSSEETLERRTPSPIFGLIANFSPRLVKLRLCSHARVSNTRLYRQINEHMPQLRELDLGFRSPQPEPLPIVKQLSHFRLHYHFTDIEVLKAVVLKYLREGCERLVKCELMGNSIYFEDWLEVDPIVAKKITLIGEGLDGPGLDVDYDYDLLKQMTSHFTSLTWVYLWADDDCTTAQILECIRTLTQLEEFHLRFEPEHLGDLSSLVQLKLSAVRLIHWECSLAHHCQLHEWFDFAQLFPNLKSAHIENFYLEECTLCVPAGKSPHACLQEMCDLFVNSHHPELRSVQIDGEVDFDTIEAKWKL